MLVFFRRQYFRFKQFEQESLPKKTFSNAHKMGKKRFKEIVKTKHFKSPNCVLSQQHYTHAQACVTSKF